MFDKYKDNRQKIKIIWDKIHSLDGIERLTNLKSLHINCNAIKDISKISSLKNLKILQLRHNLITDISSLSNLTNLEYIDLKFNKISDITSLTNLTKLKYLDLSENNITDLSPLSNLTKLDYLAIASNVTFKTLSPILKLKKLKILGLPKVSIEEIPILFNLLNNSVDKFNNHTAVYIGAEFITAKKLINFVKSKSKNIFI